MEKKKIQNWTTEELMEKSKSMGAIMAILIMATIAMLFFRVSELLEGKEWNILTIISIIVVVGSSLFSLLEYLKIRKELKARIG